MKYPLEANRALNGRTRIDDAFWNPKLRTFPSQRNAGLCSSS